jgi:FeS assembly SUF system protein
MDDASTFSERDVIDTSAPHAAEAPSATAPAEPAAAGGEPVLAEGSAIPQDELDRLTDDLIAALKTVYDPEIPVDIYELGLIYKVDVSDDRDVVVEMTLTAPGCPVAGEMPGWVQNAVSSIPGVRSAHVDLVFEPPWDSSKMSDEARLQLNMF